MRSREGFMPATMQGPRVTTEVHAAILMLHDIFNPVIFILGKVKSYSSMNEYRVGYGYFGVYWDLLILQDV